MSDEGATIMRVERRELPFLIVDKRSVEDERLSYRARGLHHAMLAKPDDWDFSSERLADGGKEGRDAVRAAMKELEGYGYLERRREHDDRGQLRTVVVVYEVPDTEDGIPGAGQPAAGFPGDNRNTLTETSPVGTDVPTGPAQLELTKPGKRALSPAELIADRFAKPILEVISRGRAFNLTEELELAWTGAWQQCIAEGLNPKPCGVRLLGYFYTALTGEEPQSKDYAKLGTLIGRWGKLALWGLDAALRRGIEGWLPYAQEVCQRLWDEQQARERVRSVQA